MIPQKLPTYNVSTLEELAEDCVKKTFGQIEIPIDVDRLLESQPDTVLEIWPGLSANHKICGVVFVDQNSGEFLVQIDDKIADRNRNRYRMTVAEELGHIVLHGQIIRGVRDLDDFRALQRHPQWHEIERNAKRFAAAVLMPRSILIREADRLYREMVSKVGYGNSAAVQKYLKSLLADRFEVSVESMGYRLNEWPMKIMAKVESAINDRVDHLF